jgi:dihydrolipoamide dehydrogenase
MKELQTPLVILGGGPAGYVAAIRAAQLGCKAVLIEEDTLGGVCMNRGCIPAKALIKSSKVVTDVNHSQEFGVISTVSGVNWDSAVRRKNRIIKNQNIGILQLVEAKGVSVIHGRGELQSDKEIMVENEGGSTRLIFEKLILATGSEPLVPSIKGINSTGVINSTEALDLEKLPESIIIVGAGVIGVEFASMFRAAGSKVIVLEAAPHILPDMDGEISTELYKVLKRQGISIKLSAKVQKIISDEGVLSVFFHDGSIEQMLYSKIVLLAVGRKPRSSFTLPFSKTGDAITVDGHMETSIKGIYAAGDVIGGRMLAHLAYAEGRVAAENALGLATIVNYNAVPSCVYTSPEIATVGLLEQEAQAQGIEVRSGKSYFRQNGRALTLGERDGFVKIVADQENIIIGAQILGANASELISELTLGIALKSNVDILADLIHPHPSLSEAIWEACGDLTGRSIHHL